MRGATVRDSFERASEFDGDYRLMIRREKMPKKTQTEQQAMTVGKLIAELQLFPENWPLLVCYVGGHGHLVLEDIVDLNQNGATVQLNLRDAREKIDAAFRENLAQNAKVQQLELVVPPRSRSRSAPLQPVS
jgi:hypothetical protein